MFKKFNLISYFIVMFSLLTLDGCASNEEQKNYFQLVNGLTTYQKNNTTKPTQVMLLESIEVASFLNKTGIVMQTEDTQYVTANNNLWTSNLSQQLDDRLDQDLSLLLSNFLIARQANQTPTLTVKLYIDGFHGTVNGDAMVKGRWVIINSHNQVYVDSFERLEPLLDNGYTALVNALSKAWQDEELNFANKVKEFL